MKFILNEKLTEEDKKELTRIWSGQGYSDSDIQQTLGEIDRDPNFSNRWENVLDARGLKHDESEQQSQTNSEATEQPKVNSEGVEPKVEPNKQEEPKVNLTTASLLMKALEASDVELWKEFSKKFGDRINNSNNPITRIMNDKEVIKAFGFNLPSAQAAGLGEALNEASFWNKPGVRNFASNLVKNTEEKKKNASTWSKLADTAAYSAGKNVKQKAYNWKNKLSRKLVNKKAAVNFYTLYNLLIDYPQDILTKYLDKFLSTANAKGKTILTRPDFYKLNDENKLRKALNVDIACALANEETLGRPNDEFKELLDSCVKEGNIDDLPNFKIGEVSSLPHKKDKSNSEKSADNTEFKNNILKQIQSGKQPDGKTLAKLKINDEAFYNAIMLLLKGGQK